MPIMNIFKGIDDKWHMYDCFTSGECKAQCYAKSETRCCGSKPSDPYPPEKDMCLKCFPFINKGELI